MMDANATRGGREAWMDVDLRALARTGPVHFVGIGGAGMSALAELVLRAGGRVSGCDTQQSATTRALEKLGAEISQGHDATHARDAVAVVTTAAVPPEHPELVAARARGIPVLKRAQALGALVNRGTLVAIAGTHGKTTTTAMTAAILAEAGKDPTGFVGGTVPAWGSGLRAGSDALFVVEADEYDRSFFALRPQIAVLTLVEPDHLDVYGTAEAVEAAFLSFIELVPREGLVAGCVDDAGARRVLAQRQGLAVRYGTSDDATLRAVQVRPEGRGMRFIVRDGEAELGRMEVGAPGLHNVRNALGALAAARRAGADFGAARRALAAFTGVERRLQELGSAAGVTVVDDYAHHPTEIAASIAACRAVYGGRSLIAAFQPHLYTRTRDFALDFGSALAGADEVWLTDVYAAREQPIEGVSGSLVARAVEQAGAPVHYVPALRALVEALTEQLRAGDVCLLMGAGDIDHAAHDLLARLHTRGER